MPMVENKNTWRAYNPDTGEMCPHNHHSKTSAKRCGLSAFGESAKAVKWVETKQCEDGFRRKSVNRTYGRKSKRRAMRLQSRLLGGKEQ